MEYMSKSVRAEPLWWVVGKTSVCETGYGCRFLVQLRDDAGEWKTMTYSDLPVEFWNHELMEVEPDCEDSLIRFSQKFGFLFSPLRNDEDCLSVAFDHDLEKIRDVANAIGETGNAQDNEMMGVTNSPRSEYEQIAAPAISISEVASTVRVLQSCVANLASSIRGGEYFVHADMLNAASCNPLYACNCNMEFIDRRCETLRANGLLTSAICNQILESMGDKALWRECERKNCSRIFKRKHGSKNPHVTSRYCCTRCEQAQRKANSREAAKNRIKH